MTIRPLLLGTILSFACAHHSAGQEMFGSTLGNYAGLNSIQLNPSAMHNSKQYLDIHILGGDFFIQNNYLYQSKTDYRFTNFFDPGYEFPVHMEDYGTEERIFYTYRDKTNKNAFINERINGPGVMLIYGDHAFGLTTGVRTISSFYKIPYDIANFAYLGLNYVPQQDINYHDTRWFTVAAMGWGEIGLSYSLLLHKRGIHKVAAGVSVRRLFGIGGAYITVDDADYMVPDDSTLIVNNLDGRAGFSLPMDYNTNEFNLDKLTRGGGFGFDAGVTYTRLVRSHQKVLFNKPCEVPYEDYIYRVGIALIDIGRVKFKDNAQAYHIDNRASTWTDLNNLEFSSINQMMDTISYRFYGDNTSAYSGDSFKIWLPSALSAQFDYHYQGPWYVNASLIYGFNLSKIGLTRPSQISITPRYESRWIEANLPVSLYNWDLLRIGFSVRLWILTLGTEKLGQFFHANDFTGMDFYFTLKVPLEKGSCSPKGPGGCPAMDHAPSFKKKRSAHPKHL